MISHASSLSKRKKKKKFKSSQNIRVQAYHNSTFLSRLCLPFSLHLTQLLSNFFKYSSSNFPLFYPNKIFAIYFTSNYHMQVHPSRNYIPVVKSSQKHISLPSMAATFLATHLIAVLQPSGYSIFYGRDTPIQLGLP